MRKAEVLRNGEIAGLLVEKEDRTYTFEYDPLWFADPSKPAISLTLPKTTREHASDHLFPFFCNMLSEGINREFQARLLKIDPRDLFGLLVATSGPDTIGAVTVQEIPI